MTDHGLRNLRATRSRSITTERQYSAKVMLRRFKPTVATSGGVRLKLIAVKSELSDHKRDRHG
jgi:hypothetical protein